MGESVILAVKRREKQGVVYVSEIIEVLKRSLKFEVMCYSSSLEFGNHVNVRL